MKNLILGLVLTISFQANAQANFFDLSAATITGTGCKAGESAVDVNNQNTIYLYNLVAESKGSLDRKACSIAVPVSMPANYQLAVLPVTDGFVQVDRGSAKLNVETFFSGSVGNTLQKDFVGLQAQDYQAAHLITWANLVWSACGAQTLARVNVSVLTQGQAVLTAEKIKFWFFFRKCK